MKINKKTGSVTLSKKEAIFFLDVLGGMAEDTYKLVHKGSKNRSKLSIEEFMKAGSIMYYQMSNSQLDK